MPESQYCAFFRKEDFLLVGGESPFILHLICMHRGGWFGRDLRNRMICTCRFVVTVVIIGA